MSAPPDDEAKHEARHEARREARQGTAPGASADRSMGNMNPERLQRLRRSPSDDDCVYTRVDASPLPTEPAPTATATAADHSSGAVHPPGRNRAGCNPGQASADARASQGPSCAPPPRPASAPGHAPVSLPARPPAPIAAPVSASGLTANSSSKLKHGPGRPPNGRGQIIAGPVLQAAAGGGPRPQVVVNVQRPPIPALMSGANPAAGRAAQYAAVRVQGVPVVVKQPPRVTLPPISSMTGMGRPRGRPASQADAERELFDNGPCSGPVSHQGGGQPYDINADTRYLEGMLGYHRFRLTVQPWATKIGSMTYSRIITHAGLLLHKFLKEETTVPVLNLPSLTYIDGKPVTDGPFDQTIRGQVLEEVWSSLTPTVKFSIARQLRKIVTAMRAVGGGIEADTTADITTGKTNGNTTGTATGNTSNTITGTVAGTITAAEPDRLLGSARSGPWSIIMDRHRTKTYWTIQHMPTNHTLVSFLQATFDPDVPRTISNALFERLHAEYPLVLSHGELAPRSIVIDNTKIVAILGWNCSGWYPEWWDYAKFFETGTRACNRDWYDYASEIFDKEYPEELATYQGFVRCQKP